MPESIDDRAPAPAAPAFLAGDGEAARLMRATDWGRTPVGPVETWPRSLRTLIGVLLNSRHPMFLWWGPALVQFYNDAYIPSFGRGKHPQAMGQRGADCWQEIWPIIGPQIDDVMQRGMASWNEDQLVPIFRNGRIEDVYWTYGYSPVIDEHGAVGGTLVVCSETTSRVVAERRQQAMRSLANGLTLALPEGDVAWTTRRVLRAAYVDVPACLLFRWSDRRQAPVGLAEATGDVLSQTAGAIARRLVEEPAHFDALASGASLHLSDVIELPGPRGPEPVTEVLLVPVRSLPGEGLLQFAAFALNPRVPFDDEYHQFLQQLADNIALATTRSESERVKRVSEDERNNLLMQAPVATAVLVGPEFVFQLANPMYCRLVGRTDMLGKTYAQVFPELMSTELPEILRSVYLTGRRYVSPETLVRLDLGDGALTDRYVEYNLEPMHGLDGEVYGQMAVAVDVTSQVLARQQLERTNAERQRLLERAQSAARAKDEFLALLGHELRNPLAPIVSALRVMEARSDASTGRERAVIQRQVNHLVRLVDDLMDVSRIARGKVELRRTSSPLAEILTKAVEMVRQLIDRRGHELELHLPAEPVMWWGDAARLTQVVVNLLTNAARYTPVHGQIRLGAQLEGGDVVIEVVDNGVGIAPDVLPHIFESFYQGHRGVDRAEGGLGLGLALVQNLVALHGGTAQAFSDGVGSGSRFVVRLPLRAALPPAGAAEPARADAPEAKRVLIVDDNRDAAELVAELLRMDGHEVRVAFDPHEALRTAAQFAPQVALLDIGLPDMDGHELARRLRERFGADACRLIALSGYGQDSDRARGAVSGFATYLIKPVDLDALRAAIEPDPAAPR